MIKREESMQNKERLDVILVKQGFFKTRQKAKFAIEEGQVYLNDKQEKKAGKLVLEEDKIEIKGENLPFVSRGGLKLEKAISSFKIELRNKTCLDIGASTGGFTDCMLQHQAKKVYCIDVGHDQLEERLRKNPKVVNYEGLNIKQANKDSFEPMDFITADVSFIPIEQVLPKIYELLKIKGKAVILIKPQFEAGRSALNKKGVVKDKKIHKQVLLNVIESANQVGFKILNLEYSPIKGPAGNIEFLLYIEKNEDKIIDQYSMQEKVKQVIEQAHKNLK